MDLSFAGPYLRVIQIILGLALTLVILLQTRGSGFSGGTFSSDSSIYRTRRGVEATLFQFTIALTVVFVGVSILTAFFARG